MDTRLRSNAAAGPFSSQPSGLRVFWLAALSLIGRRPLHTGSFVPFTMKHGSSTDSAYAPKIELSRYVPEKNVRKVHHFLQASSVVIGKHRHRFRQ